MFIRKKLNKSGNTSIQIISKLRGRYKVLESVGVGKSEQEISNLMLKAYSLLKQHRGEPELFTDEEESRYEAILSTMVNNQIRVVGTELIYGSLYDKIGYNRIEDDMFRHLVLTRLYSPGSKLKTINYLSHYMGVEKGIQELYLIPVPEKFKERFSLKKPVVIADSGLLSRKNIELLEENKYEYILGGRPKNESEEIKELILNLSLSNEETAVLRKSDTQRIIISYSEKRAFKDMENIQLMLHGMGSKLSLPTPN